MNPRTRRQSRQGLESRQRILDATFEIANELGYEGTSIAKVSVRCGLPASSVYWHFADKDELFSEVIRDSFERWWEDMPRWEPLAPGEARRDAVALRIHRAVDSIAANPEFWRLGLMLTLERQAVERSARRRFVEIRRFVLDHLAAFWRTVLPAATDTGESLEPAELLARFSMATADGIFVAAQAEGAPHLHALADILADSLEAAALRVARSDAGAPQTPSNRRTPALDGDAPDPASPHR